MLQRIGFVRLELYRYDIAGSIAHAAALTQAEMMTVDERQKIESELRAIEKQIESGKFERDRSLEDVHMNIEAALTKRIGAAGAKLHNRSQMARMFSFPKRKSCRAQFYVASFNMDIANLFDVRRSLAERRAIGAPSPENVAVRIACRRSELVHR